MFAISTKDKALKVLRSMPRLGRVVEENMVIYHENSSWLDISFEIFDYLRINKYIFLEDNIDGTLYYNITDAGKKVLTGE